ncbi:MAG TPA: DUF2512 family protein [Bacillota bacterium]|nr:DUF2512 family protein [Bacillota bacterium]
MDHLKILGVKFLLIYFSVLALFELFEGATMGVILWMSILVTIISYVVGDLFILRQYNNLTASLADFGLTFISLWLLANMYIGGGSAIVVVSLLSAFFIACCEPFIHIHMENKFMESRNEVRALNRLQPEFARETDVHDIQNNSEYSKRP